MSKEYIRIYCCGDCIHYDYKRHKCKRGAKDEGTGRERFYRDCPEKIYTDHDIESMYTWSTDADKALDMAVYALREKERRKDEEGRRMTLEEAIIHAEAVAQTKEREAKENRSHGGWAYDDEAKKCSACAAEHRQLAEWLKELKERREKDGQ